jgi:hypothetical protein
MLRTLFCPQITRAVSHSHNVFTCIAEVSPSAAQEQAGGPRTVGADESQPARAPYLQQAREKGSTRGAQGKVQTGGACHSRPKGRYAYPQRASEKGSTRGAEDKVQTGEAHSRKGSKGATPFPVPCGTENLGNPV